MHILLFISRVLFVLCTFFCAADEDLDRSFCAISSLRFHLESLNVSLNQSKKADEESLLFREDDVAALWESALLYEPTAQQIEFARQQYYAIFNGNSLKEPQKVYECVQNILEKIWENLRTKDLLESDKATIDKKIYPNFDDNPYLNNVLKNRMRPYLIPLRHPMKLPLDQIFSASRAIQNETSLINAGFRILFAQPITYIKVVSHPLLPGHLLKIYLDNELRLKEGKPGWVWLVQRCEGAENIRKLIKKKKLRYFVVPNKWIYPLPSEPSPPMTSEYTRQPIVLLVQDMKLVGYAESVRAWQEVATPAHLDELYEIISRGFASRYLPGNIPYTKNGKFACIDTEYPKRKPNYKGVRRYLSPEMQKYWDKLVRKGGRKNFR